jgi:hypothetical protein
MIYQISQIKTTLSSSSTLAIAAGVGSMSNRVFVSVGEIDMTGQLNIGRLPLIYLKEITSEYVFDAEPNHIGTRTVDYSMRIIVPTFINRSETQYLTLERMKAAALSALTKNLNLGITNVRTQAPQVTQMATIMDVTFSTETSYDNNYKEGN